MAAVAQKKYKRTPVSRSQETVKAKDISSFTEVVMVQNISNG